MDKLSILVSGKCFGNCKGCYLDNRAGKDLRLDQIINFAALLNNLGFSAITLSGGDPLVRQDIGTIISFLKTLGFNIHLDTIGRPLLDRGFLSSFSLSRMSRAIDLIGIPLDGDSDEIIKMFRTDMTNMKRDTLKILQILNDNNFQISINTVVHKGNVGNLNKIYQLVTAFPNVKRWELHQFAPLSIGAKSIRETLEITNDEFKRAIDSIDNPRGILISPKFKDRKLNFIYLDFNGDFVRIIDGKITILFNIVGMENAEIKKRLSFLTKT